jgi:hypothetical protein
MLRALVLLLLLVNVALYGWLRADPQALQPDREPQRLQHQVSPEAIQVLPDLPASAASAPAPAASAAASAASVALTSGDIDTGCAETPPLEAAQLVALKAALIEAGVPADAIAERRQSQGGSWIAYLGRFSDATVRQQRASELGRLNVKFDPVNAPAALNPGLSLGRFSTKADAVTQVEALVRLGVHGARVVTLIAPVVQRHLQVHAVDQAWRQAARRQRFDSCALDAASTT